MRVLFWYENFFQKEYSFHSFFGILERELFWYENFSQKECSFHIPIYIVERVLFWSQKECGLSHGSDQLSFSGQFHQTHWSHGHHSYQVDRKPISDSSGIILQFDRYSIAVAVSNLKNFAENPFYMMGHKCFCRQKSIECVKKFRFHAF